MCVCVRERERRERRVKQREARDNCKVGPEPLRRLPSTQMRNCRKRWFIITDQEFCFETGAAILNSMTVPQKIKNGTTL